jgi:hypothetical protein
MADVCENLIGEFVRWLKAMTGKGAKPSRGRFGAGGRRGDRASVVAAPRSGARGPPRCSAW